MQSQTFDCHCCVSCLIPHSSFWHLPLCAAAICWNETFNPPQPLKTRPGKKNRNLFAPIHLYLEYSTRYVFNKMLWSWKGQHFLLAFNDVVILIDEVRLKAQPCYLNYKISVIHSLAGKHAGLMPIKIWRENIWQFLTIYINDYTYGYLQGPAEM